MVAVGFLCVLAAIGLLIAGLMTPNPALVWASILMSALGGLIVSISRAEPGPAAAFRRLRRRAGLAHAVHAPADHREPAERADPPDQGSAAQRGGPAEPGNPSERNNLPDPPEPPDQDAPPPRGEPGEEPPHMADLLVVIDLDDEVLVIDLHPRYHLSSCAYVRGREAIRLAIRRARETGFTPCDLCRPDATLAAAVRASR